MKKLETTLLLLRKENQILLAKKKRGFGEGKYNGVGGKIECNETIEEAMIRECEEEIFVTPTEYEKVGEITFLEYVKEEETLLTFHLFIATNWDNEPNESDEMIPKWFDIENIPYDEMFPDDKYWLPEVLKGNKIDAYFEFDKAWNIIKHKITKIN